MNTAGKQKSKIQTITVWYKVFIERVHFILCQLTVVFVRVIPLAGVQSVLDHHLLLSDVRLLFDVLRIQLLMVFCMLFAVEV